ncbi:MAG: hypothetical protein J3K34DRAFT_405212 [Monoraphidium minutum]|nr:MAG: hypothetical protein J3K34DRAFT_405212 [Monoraphidium minutum]
MLTMRGQALCRVQAARPCLRSPAAFSSARVTRRTLRVRASADPSTEPGTEKKGEVLENPDSEAARKRAEAERLRAAEKFMVIGSGTAQCKGCGYEYKPENGDPDFPVPKGVLFQDLPDDYVCPICGAAKPKFESRVKVVAGFAENQQYGLGTNSMTGNQKLLLIYGALLAFVLLFLSGYALE